MNSEQYQDAILSGVAICVILACGYGMWEISTTPVPHYKPTPETFAFRTNGENLLSIRGDGVTEQVRYTPGPSLVPLSDLMRQARNTAAKSKLTLGEGMADFEGNANFYEVWFMGEAKCNLTSPKTALCYGDRAYITLTKQDETDE